MLAYGVGARQIQGPSFLNGNPVIPPTALTVVAKVPAGATRNRCL